MMDERSCLVVYLDRDFDRLGFDRAQIAEDGIELAESERLSAETILIAVATYIGGRILEKATDGALKRVLDRLLAFARSKQKRLKLELESKNIDSRVSTHIASIESIDSGEFASALAAIPSLRELTAKILVSKDEHWRELVFLWSDGEWQLSFGITSDGEVIEDITLVDGPG